MDEDEEEKDEDDEVDEDEDRKESDGDSDEEDNDQEDEDEDEEVQEGEDEDDDEEEDEVEEDEVGNWGDNEYESYEPLPTERTWKDRPVKGDKRATRSVHLLLKRKKKLKHNGRLYLPPGPRKTSQQSLKKRQRKN